MNEWMESFLRRVGRDCRWCGEHILLIPAVNDRDDRVIVQVCDAEPDEDGWVHLDPVARRAFINRWDTPEGVVSFYRHDCQRNAS